MTTLPTPELLALVAGLMATAILAGVLAGLLGVGGGIVLVPALFWILSFTDFPPDLAMHMAVATSLATIIFTSISSARAHDRRGGLDRALLRLWAPGLVLGALSGGLLARYFNADALKAVFGGIALLVAANMASTRTLVVSSHLPGSKLVNGAISCVAGFISALMGIGGGTLCVPILSAMSVEIRRAVGTASAFGFLIGLPAAIGFVHAGWDVPGRPPFSLGYVNLIAVAIILPFSVGFAPLGAKIAHSVDKTWIKRIFALFLLITAIRMLSSAVG